MFVPIQRHTLPPGGKVASTAKGIYVYKIEANVDLVPVAIVTAENPSFSSIRSIDELSVRSQ